MRSARLRGVLSSVPQASPATARLRSNQNDRMMWNTYDLETTEHGDSHRQPLELATQEVYQRLGRQGDLPEFSNVVTNISELKVGPFCCRPIYPGV